jgi:hypothetical protein
MRASILLLPIALTTLASMPIAAQEAPRVIFCKGQCTAVDEKGVRTPAPKGTQLRENQRLETGPGTYAQLKLGKNVAMGIGERARVRFDQKSVRDRDVVILEQGRVRMLDGETVGKATTRTLELKTTDGSFALRGADIEVKTPVPGATGDSNLTFVKLNVGDARLLSALGETTITKDSVQGFTGGKLTTDKSFSIADIATTPSRGDAAPTTAPATEPVRNLPIARVPLPEPTLVGKLIDLGPILPGVQKGQSPLPKKDVPSKGEQLQDKTVLLFNPDTNTVTKSTVGKVIAIESKVAVPASVTQPATQFTITPIAPSITPVLVVTTTAPTTGPATTINPILINPVFTNPIFVTAPKTTLK